MGLLMPGVEAWAALEAAMVRVGPGMSAQAVGNTMFAFATLGLMPGPDARAALEAAVDRVGPTMNPQELSNTLWSFITLAVTRGAPLPACYPSLWQMACWLDMDSLKDMDLYNLFHAYLMHTEFLVGGVRDFPGKVTFPPWILHEAKAAWMRNVRDDFTVSRAHAEIAAIIGELGVPHAVERLTDDGYFSVDVYLPDGDVALEVDGPFHFINIAVRGDGGAPGGASRTSTRNVRTEMRDLFLARRHHAVVTVPWFEWGELRGRVEKRKYVAEMLRGAGVRVPSSAE